MASPKGNDPGALRLGLDGSWLPRIARVISERGGAQECVSPFLDPFARARRNSVPE